MRRSLIPLAWVLFAAGCGRQAAAPEVKASLTPVKMQRIESQVVSQETEYSANIAPDRQVNTAFRLGGYVDRLLQVGGRDVQEGDVVAKGTVLAALRMADFVTKLNQAKAQLAQATAGLAAAKAQAAEARAGNDDAQADFNRAKSLFATQSLTKSDYDGATAKAQASQAKYDAALAQAQMTQAQIDAATQSVRDAELALQDSELKAPIGGVVLKKAIETGSLAAPGQVAFVIANIQTVKAVFGIPDSVVSTLKPGQALAVESEGAPGTAFRGRISNISPSADIKSRVFDVDVAIPNPSGRLKTGMIATVKIMGAGGEQHVLVLPLSSVVRSKKNSDQYAVFVLEGDSDHPVARLREVQIGKALNTGVIVLSGVSEGARLVTSGSSMISDGETVQIVP